MDKNSIIGMVLMAAVILGFMMLNRPSEEQLRQQREQAEQLAELETQQSGSTGVLRLDSVSPAEVQTIAATVRELGRKDSINGSAVLDIDKMHLVLNAAGELSGTVTVDNRSIAVADMLSNRWNDIPTAVASEAVSTLRKSLADAARYRGFA